MRGTTASTLSFTDCPTKIVEHIVSYLFLEDIANLSAANRHFYAVFDPLLYYEDAKPFNRHAIYWAAVNASIAVAKKALDGGTPLNDHSDTVINTTDWMRRMSTITINERDTSYFGNLPASESVQPANMAAFVTFFLNKGATVPPAREYKPTALDEFPITPLRHAMTAMPSPYLKVIQHHQHEVVQLGEFSSRALVRLAVASGNVDYARETLKQRIFERQLYKGDGHDLLRISKSLEMPAMTAMIMETIKVHGASEIDRCIYEAGGKRDLVTFVKRMVKKGASIYDVSNEEWEGLDNFSDARSCFRIITGGHGNYLNTNISLRRVAYILANMDILDICVQSDDDIDSSSQETLMMMMECACRWGDLGWARMLLDRGADIRAFSPPGDHPSALLYDAAGMLDPDLIKLLLDHGMQASGHPKDGKRSLLAKVIMCGRGDKKNIVRILFLLLEAGAATDQVIADITAGYEPFTRANRLYSRLERDHDDFTLERRDTERRGCLGELCQSGCLELLECHGIVIYRPDQLYLRGALNENNVPLLERLLQDDVLNRKAPFTESGIIPPTQTRFSNAITSRTIMFHALEHLNDDLSGDTALNLINILFKHGITVQGSSNNIISTACSYYVDNPEGTMRVMRLLLDMGAPTTGPGNERLAAIQAIPGTNLKIQRFLLRYSVDLDIPDPEGMTALEALCEESTDKDRKVLDLYLDHNPSLAANAALMDKIAELATKCRNVSMLRTIFARRLIKPKRILTWALHPKRIYQRRLDERTVAFAIAMGGLEDAARAGERSNEEVSLLGAVMLGNEDVVMTILHWYRYCAYEWEAMRLKNSLDIAKEKNMLRAVAYLEQNPDCTATGCPRKHIPRNYNPSLI